MIRQITALICLIILTFSHPIQPVNADENAPVCVQPDYQGPPVMVIASDGDAIIAWEDSREEHGKDIYVQKISPEGIGIWNTNGISACTSEAWESSPVLTPDNSGGVFIAWTDTRNFTPENGNYDIFAQRLDAQGNLVWPETGIPVCTTDEAQMNPQICSDGKSGIFIVWTDDRSPHLFIQRLDEEGRPVLHSDGIALCTSTKVVGNGSIISDGNGGVISVWINLKNGSDTDIYCQRNGPDGAMLWEPSGVPVCASYSRQWDPSLCPDSSGGAFILWDTMGSTYRSLHAQHINAQGVVQWAANGITVCNTNTYIYNQQMLHDENDGLIVIWQSTATHFSDILAQHIDGNGNRLWAPAGIPVCNAERNQHDPYMTKSESQSAVIVWQDDRNTGGTNWDDVYAQRMDFDGNLLWEPDGIPVSRAQFHQMYPIVCSSRTSGAVITWNDFRNDDGDIYCQHINSDGSLVKYDFTPTPTPTIDPNITPTITPTKRPNTATPTPTPVPTDTPTVPSQTPVSPSPTAPPSSTLIRCTIVMPDCLFSPGDTCWCSVIILNRSDETYSDIPLFVILDVYDTFFFAPKFGQFGYYTIQLEPGEKEIEVLPEFRWPDDVAPASGIIWYAAMTDPDITQLWGEMDSFPFGWQSDYHE